ncbi:MAG: SDR family oxidoreductase [Gammaproteobacteria bacterium]
MILLTGVTGKTGGEVARQLVAARVPFRALLRNPAKAAIVQSLTPDAVVGDLADEAVLQRAMAGITRAFLVLPNNQEQLRLEKRFSDAAVRHDVRHLVKLSSLESVPESKNPITRNHVASEQYIRASGIAWTMIRPTFFMQTFLTLASGIRERGVIRLPAGKGTIAPTDLRDVGAVIVRVLTGSGHEGQSYDLTGPDLLTLDAVARTFSRVLGREIRYASQPMEEFRQRLAGLGLSPWRVNAVCMEFDAIAAGAIDHTTDVIRRLLGRPPHGLSGFIGDHLTQFR